MEEKNETSRLVWLTVNSSYSHSSLTLPLIHAVCREAAPLWHWRHVEITAEEDPARIASEIAGAPCDLLCVSLYLFNRAAALNIIRRVHALKPSVHIAIGGPECAPEDAERLLAEYPCIGTVFCGEGEVWFPFFLNNFGRLRTTRQILPASGTAVFGEWKDAPPPETDVFFRTDKPFVQIETSRGCPMSCLYCTSSGIPQRYRSIAQVEAELNLLREKGVREVRVLDRTYNLPQERGAALLRLFAAYSPMRFHMEIHPQFLGPELRECLRCAAPGLLHVEAGIQSLDPAVQQAIGRRSDVEKAYEGLCFLASCKAFETHADLLAGLPGQTLRSLMSDVTRLIQAGPAEIQLEVLKILPGTPIRRVLGEYGIVHAPDPPYDVMQTDTMTASDILHARLLSRLLDLFYNHRALHPVLRCASEKTPDFLLRLAETVRENGTEPDSFLNLRKRFLFLQALLADDQESLDTLAVRWLDCGFPPGDGPAAEVESVSSVPSGAVPEDGAELLTHRDSRFRCLRTAHGTLYFVYNRRFRMNGPCAVWK